MKYLILMQVEDEKSPIERAVFLVREKPRQTTEDLRKLIGFQASAVSVEFTGDMNSDLLTCEALLQARKTGYQL